LPGGSDCSWNLQCASRSCRSAIACIPTTMCCPSTCASGPTPRLKSVGEACVFAQMDCVPSAYCHTVEVNSMQVGTCTPRIADGQPCDTTFLFSCQTGRFCFSPTGDLAGTCVKFPAEGEACDPRGLPLCPGVDFCDPATSRCTPRIPVGGACPLHFGCVNYARCDPSTDTCVPLAFAGGSCAGVGDVACFQDIYCTMCSTLICTPSGCALPPPWVPCH
jgi:hypothetical protein